LSVDGAGDAYVPLCLLRRFSRYFGSFQATNRATVPYGPGRRAWLNDPMRLSRSSTRPARRWCIHYLGGSWISQRGDSGERAGSGRFRQCVHRRRGGLYRLSRDSGALQRQSLRGRHTHLSQSLPAGRPWLLDVLGGSRERCCERHGSGRLGNAYIAGAASSTDFLGDAGGPRDENPWLWGRTIRCILIHRAFNRAGASLVYSTVSRAGAAGMLARGWQWNGLGHVYTPSLERLDLPIFPP